MGTDAQDTRTVLMDAAEKLLLRHGKDEMEKLVEPYPGCLFASYCYQNELFDEEAKETVQRGLLRWRERLAGKFREVLEERTPSAEVEPENLADMLTVIFEGAFVLSKTLTEPKAIARQLRQYRTCLRLLFGEANP